MKRFLRRWDIVQYEMGGTQSAARSLGQQRDFCFLQEPRGSTLADKVFVQSVAERCGCRAFCSWYPLRGKELRKRGAITFLRLKDWELADFYEICPGEITVVLVPGRRIARP